LRSISAFLGEKEKEQSRLIVNRKEANKSGGGYVRYAKNERWGSYLPKFDSSGHCLLSLDRKTSQLFLQAGRIETAGTCTAAILSVCG
jgi:hypothetical protein